MKTPSISLTKTGVLVDGNGNGRADAGESISYSFTVTNTGQVTLTNVALTDIVGGITITGGPIATLPSTPPSAAADSTTFTGSYTLKQSDIDSGAFTNTAIVTGIPPVGSPVSATASDTRSGLSKPELTLAKALTGLLQVR